MLKSAHKTGRRGQSAFELLLIGGVITVFLTIFLIVIMGNFSDLNKKKDALLLKEFSLKVQTEIHLASKSSEGYSREFRLPLNLEGKSYEANITDGRIYARTAQNAISLNVEDVKGDVKKGINTIRKNDGVVYLNE